MYRKRIEQKNLYRLERQHSYQIWVQYPTKNEYRFTVHPEDTVKLLFEKIKPGINVFQITANFVVNWDELNWDERVNTLYDKSVEENNVNFTPDDSRTLREIGLKKYHLIVITDWK